MIASVAKKSLFVSLFVSLPFFGLFFFLPLTMALRAFADCVVLGGGIAGVATAMHLSQSGLRTIVVDPRGPLTLTSLMSTEGYRDVWTSDAMCELVSRSISLMEGVSEQQGREFGMSRRGYLFCAKREEAETELRNWAEKMSKRMDVREFSVSSKNHASSLYDAGTELGTQSVERMRQLQGIDILTGQALREAMPFLDSSVRFAMHGRRCGYINAQQYGTRLWELATEAGATFIRGQVEGLTFAPSSSEHGLEPQTIQSVYLANNQGEIRCGAVVNACGPFLRFVNDSLFVPYGAHRIFTRNEQHCKLIMKDVARVMPRTAPMTISMDSHSLWWDDIGYSEAMSYLDQEQARRHNLGDEHGAAVIARLSQVLPGGCHARPWGVDSLLCLWEWVHADRSLPSPPPWDPPAADELYPDIVLRGLASFMPGFSQYVKGDVEGGKGFIQGVDGGFYTKATDNLPLVGPSAGLLKNYLLCGALSGYGIMSSNAAGELVTRHVLDLLNEPNRAAAHAKYRDYDLVISESTRAALAPTRFRCEEDWLLEQHGEEGQI